MKFLLGRAYFLTVPYVKAYISASGKIGGANILDGA